MLLGVTQHLISNSSEATKTLLLEMLASKADPAKVAATEEAGPSASNRKAKWKANPLCNPTRSGRVTRSQTLAAVNSSTNSPSPHVSPFLVVKLEAGSSTG